MWFCPADAQAPSPTSADFFGGHSEEDPPVPIPNTEVKLFSADGTAWETMWESRSPPNFLPGKPLPASRGQGLFAFGLPPLLLLSSLLIRLFLFIERETLQY